MSISTQSEKERKRRIVAGGRHDEPLGQMTWEEQLVLYHKRMGTTRGSTDAEPGSPYADNFKLRHP